MTDTPETSDTTDTTDTPPAAGTPNPSETPEAAGEPDTAPEAASASASEPATQAATLGGAWGISTAGDAGNPAEGNMVTLNYIDVRSAARIGGLFGVAIFAVWVIAWLMLLLILSVAGVWGRMNSLIVDITGFDGISGFGFIIAMILIGVLEAAIFAGMTVLAAVIYNSAVPFVGGLSVRLGGPVAGSYNDATTNRPDNAANHAEATQS